MTEVVVFPDVESVVIPWLTGELELAGLEVGVSTRRIGDSGSRKPWIVLRSLASGGQVNMVTDQITVLMRVYAPSEVEAAHVAQFARGVMKTVAQQDFIEVKGVRYMFWQFVGDTGVYSFPDPDTNLSSYQCAMQFRVAPQQIVKV